MSELSIIALGAGACVGLIIVDTILLLVLARRVRKNEELMYKIGEVVMRETMKTLVENFHQGLENLFNPKDEIKKDVKKTRTNSKTK